MNQIILLLSKELNRDPKHIETVIHLLDEGATIPFIARYRKEITGTMTDTELRLLTNRLEYLRELEERRQVILKSIREQDKLNSELENTLLQTQNKAILEDLYLPFKPKRRTKAQIAREAGLAPLAQLLIESIDDSPEILAKKFLNPEHQIMDVNSALLGAKHILMEMLSEQAQLVGSLREMFWDQAFLISKVVPGKESEAKRFLDYFSSREKIKNIPSHRTLAMFRGQKEGFLRLKLVLEENDLQKALALIAAQYHIPMQNRTTDPWLLETVEQVFKIKLFPKLEMDLLMRLKNAADLKAIDVFSENLKNLLMGAPAGGKIVMGLDPGFRTGVKMAVVNETGKMLDYGTIYPHEPRLAYQEALNSLAGLCRKHTVQFISIGNGTASRETDKLITKLIETYPDLNLTKVMVSEAGASVYSASELGAQEFPDLDVSFRGAVSIARRLQDPLAELVKIEPKAIGVGQYQHDVNPNQLSKALGGVVEDCVNFVGVDLNRASVPLLRRVAGLNQNLAEQIVYYRDQHGSFKLRSELTKVPRLGSKAFEQAAGFLRIPDGENPLDSCGVHPEAYPVVEKILERTQKTIQDLMGQDSCLNHLKAEDFVNEQYGLLTIKDIFKELEKSGRDPRPEFKTVKFKEGIHTLKDLTPMMNLQGVVTNVTDFGAFVDIGVHQDGLLHKSEMANFFVSDPKKFIKIGQIIEVKVLQVDIERKRINLTMKLANTKESGFPSPSTSNSKSKSESKSESKFKSKASDSLKKKSDKTINKNEISKKISSTPSAFSEALGAWLDKANLQKNVS